MACGLIRSRCRRGSGGRGKSFYSTFHPSLPPCCLPLSPSRLGHPARPLCPSRFAPPSLPYAMRRHAQRRAIPKTRYRLDPLVYRVAALW